MSCVRSVTVSFHVAYLPPSSTSVYRLSCGCLLNCRCSWVHPRCCTCTAVAQQTKKHTEHSRQRTPHFEHENSSSSPYRARGEARGAILSVTQEDDCSRSRDACIARSRRRFEKYSSSRYCFVWSVGFFFANKRPTCKRPSYTPVPGARNYHSYFL